MDRETFYREMTRFIAGLHSRPGEQPAVVEIAPGDNLFDEGHVTSLSVVQVMSYIEKITGSQIDLSEYDIESFSTLSKLYSVMSRQQDKAAATAS